MSRGFPCLAVLSFALLASCGSPEPSSENGDASSEVGGDSRLLEPFITIVVVDTVSVTRQLTLLSSSSLQLDSVWRNSAPRGYISAGPHGFAVSGLGLGSLPVGVCVWDWSGEHTWTLRDSSIVDGYPQMLGACQVVDDSLLVSASSRRLMALRYESGNDCHWLDLSGGLGGALDPAVPHFVGCGRSIGVSDLLLVICWPFTTVRRLGVAASVYDRQGQELFTLAPKPETEGLLGECVASCSDTSIYIANVASDLVLELTREGSVVRALTAGHTPFGDLVQPSVRGGPAVVVSPVISDIQYSGGDTLWVLYGPGAFPGDSSEVWCIDLATRDAALLGVHGNAIGMAVWDGMIAVSLRADDANAETMQWSDPENRILVGSLEIRSE